jgi:hypothetical protein
MNAADNTMQTRRQLEQAYLDNLFDRVPEADEPATARAYADFSRPVECQLILAAGLKLAVPLAAFSRVLTDIGEIESAADMNGLQAGCMRHEGRIIDVISLAAIVLDGQNSTRGPAASAARSGAILLLHDDVTGLLCDGLAERVTVAPDRLCWRDAHSRRIWLAATARSDGFALLDIEGVTRLLQRSADAQPRREAGS